MCAVGSMSRHPSRRGVPPIPPGFLLFPILAALTISLKTQGIYGAFWCYPAVIFCYFALPMRVAGACSLTLLALSAVMLDRYIGAGVAIRFVISLGFVIGIVTVMLKSLGDLQRKLAAQAITDPLTGAFNRRHMESCLTGAIERRGRTAEPASLLLFDVDHFKQINDERGHVAGDHVLQAIVALIAGRARKLDVLFRIGGEEFVLLLPGARFAGALAVAETMRALVADAPLLDGRAISVSVGVSELESGRSPSRWVEEADAALAAAKQSGRNRVAGKAPGAATRGTMRRVQ